MAPGPPSAARTGAAERGRSSRVATAAAARSAVERAGGRGRRAREAEPSEIAAPTGAPAPARRGRSRGGGRAADAPSARVAGMGAAYAKRTSAFSSSIFAAFSVRVGRSSHWSA